jgi:hypothetical protein
MIVVQIDDLIATAIISSEKGCLYGRRSVILQWELARFEILHLLAGAGCQLS